MTKKENQSELTRLIKEQKRDRLSKTTLIEYDRKINKSLMPCKNYSMGYYQQLD